MGELPSGDSFTLLSKRYEKRSSVRDIVEGSFGKVIGCGISVCIPS